MTFKSIIALKQNSAGSRISMSSMTYRTTAYSGNKQCTIIIPYPAAKKAGIEPGTLVEVAYDAETNRVRLSVASDIRCPRVHWHGKHKNHIRTQFKLYPDWLPERPNGVQITAWEYQKGIIFELP